MLCSLVQQIAKLQLDLALLSRATLNAPNMFKIEFGKEKNELFAFFFVGSSWESKCMSN